MPRLTLNEKECSHIRCALVNQLVELQTFHNEGVLEGELRAATIAALAEIHQLLRRFEALTAAGSHIGSRCRAIERR